VLWKLRRDSTSVHEKTLQGVQESKNPLRVRKEKKAQEGQRYTCTVKLKSQGAHRGERDEG
jgi:hypothetical protein